MYSPIYSGNVYKRSIDLDVETYFKSSNYKIDEPRMFYRVSSYVNMFDFGIKRPIYFGINALERYLTGIALRMQVRNEYLTNAKTYTEDNEYHSFSITSAEIHNPVIFINEDKETKEIISNLTHELASAVRKIFRLSMGKELPEDIAINILSFDDLKNEHRKHSKNWNDETVGFAITKTMRNEKSLIFIKENKIEHVLLTIGHEIGHSLSIPKENSVLEEAKAFAFELLWMETIHKFNILNLREAMNISLLNPSVNGLHNVALDFVRKNLWDNTPIKVFKDIINDQLVL